MSIYIYIYIYINVAIERYMRLLWATVVGMCMFYLWFMVGELRSPGNRVTPWRFAPRWSRTLRWHGESDSRFVGSRRVHVYVLMWFYYRPAIDQMSM